MSENTNTTQKSEAAAAKSGDRLYVKSTHHWLTDVVEIGQYKFHGSEPTPVAAKDAKLVEQAKDPHGRAYVRAVD